MLPLGAVAQLGERRVRNAKVEGSIPFRSTKHQKPGFPRAFRLYVQSYCQFPVLCCFALRRSYRGHRDPSNIQLSKYLIRR